jgi:hypothetical protein
MGCGVKRGNVTPDKLCSFKAARSTKLQMVRNNQPYRLSYLYGGRTRNLEWRANSNQTYLLAISQSILQ